MRSRRAASALGLAAAALLAAGAGGQTGSPRLIGPAAVMVSPDGDGVNDVVRLHVAAGAGKLRLEAYAWFGRLIGWRTIARTDATDSTTLTWDVKNARGVTVRDGSYLVSVCRDSPHAPTHGPGPTRPGAAEASVARPPWLGPSCLARPVLVRVRRLSVYVSGTGSYAPGSAVPLVLGTDKRAVTVALERDGLDSPVLFRFRRPAAPRLDVRLPNDLAPGLYHVLVSDDRGNEFRAPVVVRARFPLAAPPAHTALVVWPYLTWRAYNGYDANGDGRPDSWYQFWRQRAVSLTGPLLAGGVEDDHNAAAPFSRWAVAHGVRFQSITDVELGSLPAAVLARYAAIVFPGHTEYYVPPTYDRVKAYRDRGGNLVFLQANPFYRAVRLERDEVVMTDYDAREARSDFALAGVGYDGCCFARSRWQPYVATRRDFPKVAWLFAGTGVGPGEEFGRAGIEDDRIDPALTPRDHVVAAEAIIRGKHGVVNSDLVVSRAGRGTTFASGNYDFLRMVQHAPSGETVARVMLTNVWRRLVLGRSSAAAPARPAVQFALPVEPRTLDPALAADLPSVNVARELYAGLTRFHRSGVVPDLAESWRPSRNGLVWTFRLRPGLTVTADDFRSAWLHALDPATGSEYARAEMLNIRGARAYHAGTGSADEVGIRALDARTLRVTLQHPVPWFDQQVAYPVYAPKLPTGPFVLAQWQHGRRIELAKNASYWNARNVLPGRIELRFGTRARDGVLPAGTVAPGFPWIDTAPPPPRGARSLPTLAIEYLWFATRHAGLRDGRGRGVLARDLARLRGLVPRGVGGYRTIVPAPRASEAAAAPTPPVTLVYAGDDRIARRLAAEVQRHVGVAVVRRSVPTRDDLLAAAGPPPASRADLIILGWSGEFFDAYNFYDQFACSSALNVAQWCDRGFDALMHRAVRTLDPKKRYAIERKLEAKLEAAAPAVALANPKAYVVLEPGVRGFEWSPIGFWDLRRVRRG